MLAARTELSERNYAQIEGWRNGGAECFRNAVTSMLMS